METKHNYLVVLFKNKKRKKIINKFVTKNRCEKFYNDMIKNDVIFNKSIENGKICDFELAILEKSNTDFESYFIKDDFGRNIKIELDDDGYKIIKISSYDIEEFILDRQINKKISFDSFIKRYIPKTGIKMVSRLNNKIVVQNDDKYSLFVLKSELDSTRFLDVLEDYLISKNRIDCIVVHTSTKEQKKYTYEKLVSLGFDKSFLYRKSTTSLK